MIEQWWFPVVLAIVLCTAIGMVAAVVDMLRRRFGDRRLDVAGGAMLFLLLTYVAIGTGFAIFLAFGQVVPSDEIEYDSREFIR